MIFIIIRIIVLSLVLFLLLKKDKVNKSKTKKIILIAVSIALFVVSALIPFENVFITFSTPEASYKYHNQGTPVICVEGQDTDLVVGQKGDSYIYNIAPKTANGWKLGMGYELKNIYQTIDSANKNLISVFRYKNTNEFYLVVTNIEGESLSVHDNLNSAFVLSEKTDKNGSANDYVYYTYINALDNNYVLSLNDIDISLGELALKDV